MEFDKLPLDTRENLGLIAIIIHKAWQGEDPISEQEIEEFNKLMDEKFFRNIFVACLQQYRLAGQFTLNFAGFEHIKNMLCCFLEKCFDQKDTVNAYKTIILSQTFWRNFVLPTEKESEKVYLHSEIKDLRIWKNLEFWQAAIFVSLYKELLFKNSVREHINEQKNDSAENQNLIVTGQLMSFVHMMHDFGIDKKFIQTIIKQFNQYYNLEEKIIKELENITENLTEKDVVKSPGITDSKVNNTSKKGKLDSIKNLFNKKNTSNGPRSIIETQSKLVEGKTK